MLSAFHGNIYLIISSRYVFFFFFRCLFLCASKKNSLLVAQDEKVACSPKMSGFMLWQP